MHHLLKSNVLFESEVICIFLMVYQVSYVVALISIRSLKNIYGSLHSSSTFIILSIYLLVDLLARITN